MISGSDSGLGRTNVTACQFCNASSLSSCEFNWGCMVCGGTRCACWSKKDSFIVLNLKVWVNLRFAKVQILESLLYETMAFLVGAS